MPKTSCGTANPIISDFPGSLARSLSLSHETSLQSRHAFPCCHGRLKIKFCESHHNILIRSLPLKDPNMGCVSSKYAKREALSDEKRGRSPLSRRKRFDSLPHDELSFEEYHRQLVSLASSSYGLLKPETQKPVRLHSLDSLYDRLDALDFMEAAPKPWHEVDCNLQSYMPGLHRSISVPVPHPKKSAVHETINVADIMQGLEEGACSLSSPSKAVGSSTPSFYKLQAPPVPDLLGINHNKLNKFASFYNTGEGSANSQDQYVSADMGVASDKTREAIVESKSHHRDHWQGLSQAPSRVSYAAASRMLKVTLNLEYENSVIAGMQMGRDICESTGSSAGRSIVDDLTAPNSPLFDPALLASYERAMEELTKEDWSITDDTNDLFEKLRLMKETQMNVDAQPMHVSQNQPSPRLPLQSASPETRFVDPLNEFEWKCPPGGVDTSVVYTTTLHGVRKTFEDCNNVRDMLKSYSLGFHERDVSMHSEYRNELKELLGGQVLVPSVFIKGRYIGGLDRMVNLHEAGKLGALLKGLPQDLNGGMCDGCGNLHFIPCLTCSGSCKVVEQDSSVSRCPDCNENGLIPCPICG